MPVTESLSPKQILAAQHLALGESQGKAAQIAQVTRVTVNRWLKLPTFKAKVEEFRQELEHIEGSVFAKAANEKVETAFENTQRTLTADELKLKFSEIVQDETIPIGHRIKAGAALAKWLGLEASKPATTESSGSRFPLGDIELNPEDEDLTKLSDEELQRRYLETLAQA